MDHLVYQYGSNKCCFGMLKAHSIRLCDIRKSNDSKINRSNYDTICSPEKTR